MSFGGKLLTVVSVGKNLYLKWLMRRLIAGIVALVVLAIVTFILVSALLVSFAFATYFALVSHGVSPALASLGASGVLLLIVICCVLAMLACVKNLKNAPNEAIKQFPVTARAAELVDEATKVAEAFLKGFMKEDEPVGVVKP